MEWSALSLSMSIGVQRGRSRMTRALLSLVLLVAAAMFSRPASAEDIRSGTWGDGKSNEGTGAKVANEDGRLPHTDKGTRIVIFGANAEEARVVAVEIAQNAFWNSSYCGGSYEDIRSARLW